MQVFFFQQFVDKKFTLFGANRADACENAIKQEPIVKGISSVGNAVDNFGTFQ